MFVGRLKDIELLKEPLKSVGTIIDEGIFTFSEDGLRLIWGDRAMVAVVDFLIKKDAFKEWKLDGKLELPMSIDKLRKFVSRLTGSVEMKGDENTFVLKGFEPVEKEFTINLLAGMKREEIPPIDTVTFDGSLSINFDVLQNGLGDAKELGESAQFKIEGDKFILKPVCELHGYKFEVDKGNEQIKAWNFRRNVRSTFPADYLENIFKSKISDKIDISLGNPTNPEDGFPMKIVMKNDDIELSWFLAPRVID